MLSLLYAGLALGATAGFSPGPLTVLLLRATLQHGRGAGYRVAAAPLVTDGPIILLAWLFARQLRTTPQLLAALTLAGALFVARLGWSGLRQRTLPSAEGAANDAFRQALIVNSLSPHPWLFWALVGTPLLSQALQISPWAAPGFLLLFYLGLVGAKCILAWAIPRHRRGLPQRSYLRLQRLLGLILCALALQLLWTAWSLLQSGSGSMLK